MLPSAFRPVPSSFGFSICNPQSEDNTPMKRIILPFIICLCSVNAAGQKFEQLAQTPPMGWNSWNKFGCNVNEALIRETADAMVASGMKDAGYLYLNIDDCWHGPRD